MWVNKLYEPTEAVAWIREFVNENTLSTIITHTPVQVAHMPVELIDQETDQPKLIFHMPIVDPISQVIADAPRITVVIHGPQQYISPALYQDVGLPTFNYGVAEVDDVCRSLSRAELGDHLYRLIEEREQLFATHTGQPAWKLTAAAEERFDRLLPMLVGFEIGLDNAQVKLKMGQNRTAADRRFTLSHLRETEGINQTAVRIMEALS
ncbi:FMN-binding negative transcriptional regulator [Microbacterium sp. MPKO10]|uniref:FMN-binding negative transcriptional regulator n=1 Tax=Microbacterium sp. MPKO10 TaxID=2989818 RepID=UPI0022364C98|nr:FMN-binding negative transcriptional regulator [Microbacterium sp. MPKO10]MCW4458649.1 FMN-binding negative transcriptional regulator [Microbacterium sp. MPKO10]